MHEILKLTPTHHVQVSTEPELEAALAAATREHTDALCFIEVLLHRDDCSKVSACMFLPYICGMRAWPPHVPCRVSHCACANLWLGGT